MITTIAAGDYKLVGINNNTKLLLLEGLQPIYWIAVNATQKIFVAPEKYCVQQYVISQGKYRIYEVTKEQGLTNAVHMELLLDTKRWQGYLLPEGFPNILKKRMRIIPTKQIITKTLGSNNYLALLQM